MQKKKKIIIGAIIAAVVIAVAVVLFAVLGNKNGATKIYIQSVKSVMGEGQVANRYSGIIETQKSEKIEFDTSRQLEALYVSEGQKVKVGDKLFSYNADSINLDIAQLNLEIEKCNSTITNSQNEIAELRVLMEQAGSEDKLSYAAQIQQLEADIAQAQYDIKTKQSNITAKQKQIEEATVCATLSGTVQKIADINVILNSEDVTSADANVFITIVASGDLRVKGSVGEQNVTDLYTGQQVIVRSRVDVDQTWKGTVASINTQNAEASQTNYYSSGESSSKYSFYVNLDSTDGLLLGQHVTIEPDYGQGGKRDGVWLNSSFIISTEDGSASYVWAAKKDGARLEKRKVVLGEYDEELDMYEITSGLSIDEYVAWPTDDCKEGAATTTVEEAYYEDVYDDSYDDALSDASYGAEIIEE